MGENIQNLTLRVAWHDNNWNGYVCQHPSKNAFCVALDRIRAERDDCAEDQIAGKGFWDLNPSQHPSCKAESGAFMNEKEWYRLFKHPYQSNTKAQATHGNLVPTRFTVPPFSTFAVPFNWMLSKNQQEIQDSIIDPLPLDMQAPFPTPWIFGRERQEAILKLFFQKLTENRSLVFFYTKEGHPLGDNITRLLVGVGIVVKIGRILFYDTNNNQDSYPLWDRIISHSVRPDGTDGFLLPYNDYLRSTGDFEEDQRRLELLNEIAVSVESPYVKEFSYAAETINSDVSLSVLVNILNSIRKIRKHGVARGPWGEREEWINNQIAFTWKNRGAFPGVGSVLEALGLRLGTSLFLDLISSREITTNDNPWPMLNAILLGEKEPPRKEYKDDISAISNTWVNLDEKRRALLELLSRFDLTISQTKRLFDTEQRNQATRFPVSDNNILENPYILAESDLGGVGDAPVSFDILDRGLLPDDTIRVNHPIALPSKINSTNDPRRIRAALFTVLSQAALSGDTLLSQSQALLMVQNLPLTREIAINSDWISTNKDILKPVIQNLDVLIDPERNRSIPALQLSEYKIQEDNLRKIFIARANKSLPNLDINWRDLLIDAIQEAGGQVDEINSMHIQALTEQEKALAIITSRKLSLLVGKAGTGKTSVMGALFKAQPILQDGILLLAPTGKARVRLSNATGTEALTIAQFLNQNGRYDGARQRPLFSGGEKYRKEKTIVIDECSMLTMDDLVAILELLDLAHVQRIILVGDPNQLPPIGVGRPFADFVGYLENCISSDNEEMKYLSKAIARLTVEVRSRAGAVSDTLRLSSWFTREPQPVDGDRVLSDLELGHVFNDLEIQYWNTSEELHQKLAECMIRNLKIEKLGDYSGLDRALGADENGIYSYSDPNGVANFQILSPVRMHTHGVSELNRWVQKEFRTGILMTARRPGGTSLGDEEIVYRDKIINIRNQRKSGYDWNKREKIFDYLANGEIGVVVRAEKGFENVLFEGRVNKTFGFSKKDFSDGLVPIELAYALTIHKSQGSEFKIVFVIMPKQTRLLSRELLYTALTRAREKLVLLIEGSDPTFLYDNSRSERSDTANRNTNLFVGAIRENLEGVPYSEHLIHKTLKGHMVRSKSELVIANILFENNIEYQYERILEGDKDGRKLRPDFTFTDPAGETIIWEHLGMLSRGDYKAGWEWKKSWYEQNGYKLGENLFTTEDDLEGGLDSTIVKTMALSIKAKIL